MPRSIHAAMRAAQKKETLKVFHRGDGMVPNIEAMNAGIRAFIGVKMDHDPKSATYQQFITTDLAEEVPQRVDYLRAICEGHLAAMDDDTAKRAAAYGRCDWKTLLATDEEKKLSADTLDAQTKQDEKNVAQAKVISAPAKLPDAKLKLSSSSPAHEEVQDEDPAPHDGSETPHAG